MRLTQLLCVIRNVDTTQVVNQQNSITKIFN